MIVDLLTRWSLMNEDFLNQIKGIWPEVPGMVWLHGVLCYVHLHLCSKCMLVVMMLAGGGGYVPACQ